MVSVIKQIYCKIVQDKFLTTVEDPYCRNLCDFKNMPCFFLLQNQLKNCRIQKKIKLYTWTALKKSEHRGLGCLISHHFKITFEKNNKLFPSLGFSQKIHLFEKWYFSP